MAEGQETFTKAEVEAMIAQANGTLREELAELRGRVSAQPPKPTEEPPREYTRAQLDKAVEENQITEAQRDDIIERQNAARVQRQIDQAVDSKVTGITREQQVEQQIGQYGEIEPNVVKEGSDERRRVKQQYDAYVAMGLPKTKATELAALRTIFGEIDVFRAKKNRTQEYEHHEEGGSGDPGEVTPKGTKLKLTKDERRYYESCIEKGIYKDWKEVEAEMKYANPQIRARHGAKVA